MPISKKRFDDQKVSHSVSKMTNLREGIVQIGDLYEVSSWFKTNNDKIQKLQQKSAKNIYLNSFNVVYEGSDSESDTYSDDGVIKTDFQLRRLGSQTKYTPISISTYRFKWNLFAQHLKLNAYKRSVLLDETHQMKRIIYHQPHATPVQRYITNHRFTWRLLSHNLVKKYYEDEVNRARGEKDDL